MMEDKKESWLYAVTPNPPHTWFRCGPISKTHAAMQFKQFGIVYRKNDVMFLDYDKLAESIKKNEEAKNA